MPLRFFSETLRVRFLAIHPTKAVGGVAFSILGLISVRVQNCEPIVDLGKVLISSALNSTRLGIDSFR